MPNVGESLVHEMMRRPGNRDRRISLPGLRTAARSLSVIYTPRTRAPPLSQERTPYPRGPAREINKSARLFFNSRPKSQRNATEQRVLGRIGGKRDGDSGGAFTVIAHRMHPRRTRAACEAFRSANGTRRREGRENAPKRPSRPKATMRGMEPSRLCYLIGIRNITGEAVALPSRGLRAAWSLAASRGQPVAEPPQEEPAGHRR